MDAIGQINSYWASASGVVKVGLAVAGCLLLFVALKLGGFIMKILVGLVGLVLIGGAICWFFTRN
jgi:hypothetical protein